MTLLIVLLSAVVIVILACGLYDAWQAVADQPAGLLPDELEREPAQIITFPARRPTRPASREKGTPPPAFGPVGGDDAA